MHDMKYLQISEGIVKECIRKLESKKAAGPDWMKEELCKALEGSNIKKLITRNFQK